MKKRQPTLDEIERQLARAARILDRSARQLRDVKLNPNRNIRRIGEALVLVFEIQNEIYRKRPDLMPDFLKSKRSRTSQGTTK